MTTATRRTRPRTFRSGPYLDGLFSAAERVDAYLQKEICGRIKQARTESGFTQAEMADLLNMTLRGYQNYEADRVPFRMLGKIAELTGRTQEWLLRGDVGQVVQITQNGDAGPSLTDRLEALSTGVAELLREQTELKREIVALRDELQRARPAQPKRRKTA